MKAASSSLLLPPSPSPSSLLHYTELTMVDVSSRPQPQLGASLAGGEHDAEVILSWNKKMSFLFSSHLSNAATQLRDPLPLAPEVGGGMRGGREGGSKNESGKEGRRREIEEGKEGEILTSQDYNYNVPVSH